MKKYIPIAIFTLLIEYQILTELHSYSIITAVGLIMLSLYLVYKDSKGFKLFKQKGIIEILDNDKKPNNIRSFTIPVILVYLSNFLLSAQIHMNLAYQFILALSIIVLWDLINKKDLYTRGLKLGTISVNKFKQYLFCRWSKHLNFFLWIWILVNFAENSIITEAQKFIIILFSCVTYIAIANRKSVKLTLKSFTIIFLLIVLLAGIEPLLENAFHINTPYFISVVLLFLFFDFVDHYFYNKEISKSSLKIWEQKTIVYILIIVFIAQLNSIEETPVMNLDSMFTSVLDEQQELMQPKIDVEDIGNASIVRTDSP